MLAKSVRQIVEIPPVQKLCQNPISVGRRKLRFERKQLPQVVDIRHFRIELLERLEPANILRNQQVTRWVRRFAASLRIQDSTAGQLQY